MMFKLVVLPTPPARVGLIALKALVYGNKNAINSTYFIYPLYLNFIHKNYVEKL